MTRLIITGRNSQLPTDAAQSMAHLMPPGTGSSTIAFRPGPQLEAQLARYMRANATTNQAASIRSLLMKALET